MSLASTRVSSEGDVMTTARGWKLYGCESHPEPARRSRPRRRGLSGPSRRAEADGRPMASRHGGVEDAPGRSRKSRRIGSRPTPRSCRIRPILADAPPGPRRPGPMPGADPDVTQLLLDLGEGDAAAMDRLLPLVYDERHRLAHRHRRGERDDHTLNTTALVHEAYLKLVRLDRIRWQNRAQFFALAAQAMRRVLVTYAERRRARKRGGGAERVPLDEEALMTDRQSE